MWTLVHKYSPRGASSLDKDSTTEFVMAGWAKIRAAQHAVERQKASRAIDFGAAQDHDTGGNAEQRDQRFDESSTSYQTWEMGNGDDDGSSWRGGDEENGNSVDDPAATKGRAGLGLEGLSLDTVPNCNITKSLINIAKGLHEQPLGKAFMT